MRGEKGFALVITLIVTALLVALLVEFVNEVYVDTSHSHNFVASQQASILAESGITAGVKLIQASALLRGGGSYSSLLEPWAQPQKHDGQEGTLTLTIEEESGKLNINLATSDNGTVNDYTPIAVRLLKKVGLPGDDLADVLLDWRDLDDVPKPGGAETTYYSSLKMPYAAKNQRLETVEELGLLKGFTPAVVAKLRPLITVYGANGNSDLGTLININTAPKEVIASLDESLTDDLVERILDYRKTKPIKGMSELNSIPGIDAVSPKFSTRITFSGSVYRIRAEGRVGESVSVAEAVVRTGQSQPAVLYWREY